MQPPAFAGLFASMMCSAKEPGDDAVAMWLKRDLATRYGAVLREGIPASWLDMLGDGSTAPRERQRGDTPGPTRRGGRASGGRA